MEPGAAAAQRPVAPAAEEGARLPASRAAAGHPVAVAGADGWGAPAPLAGSTPPERLDAAEALVTVAAHDLRNYLQPLLGRIELLRRRALREGQPAYLRHADELTRSARRLERVIADVLDTARLEQGLFAIHPRPVDLAALAREAAEDFQTEEGRIEVHAPEVVVVRADPDRLRQALDNLLANALKHAPSGTPVRLEVAAEQRPDQRYARIVLVDEGRGIALELRPQLFERFASGPGSSSLGLGLYLARQIALAHDGELTLDPAPGSGARFVLTLPTERPGR